jgi:hypothetical protein
MPLWVSLVVYALAVARVTGLITADQVTADVRAWAVKRLMPEAQALEVGWRREVVYLLTCAWCVSIYVGAAAALVWYTVGNQPVLIVCAVALAFSQVAGMLSGVGRD